MRKVIFSIDIETSGPLVTEHQIIAIGYYVNDGQMVANPQRLVISGPYTYDEHTWEGFWSKHPELLEEFAKSRQYTPLGAMQRLVHDLDTLDIEYDVMIVSDNASFDFGFINYYLAKYMGRRPLNYKFGHPNGYRTLCDTDSYNSGVAKLPPGSSDAEIAKVLGIVRPDPTMHNHMPENDARYIAEFFQKILH
jgi:hypothetical protein